MNYPQPIVEIDAAKDRLQESLAEMWHLEAASRAAIENGTEEGLGDSSESAPIAFPQDIMDVDPEPVRNTPTNFPRRRHDQMVPSMSSSFLKLGDSSSSEQFNSSEEIRQEVPLNINETQEGPQMVRNNNRPPRFDMTLGPQNVEDVAESSGIGRREREGGVVPVWCPSTSSSSEPFVGEVNDVEVSSSYLQRHPQSNELIDWRQLSDSR